MFIIVFGLYKFENSARTKAPSDEGAFVFRRKMTEGEKVINNEFLVSLPQFRFAQQLPRQREPMFANVAWSAAQNRLLHRSVFCIIPQFAPTGCALKYNEISAVNYDK